MSVKPIMVLKMFGVSAMVFCIMFLAGCGVVSEIEAATNKAKAGEDTQFLSLNAVENVDNIMQKDPKAGEYYVQDGWETAPYVKSDGNISYDDIDLGNALKIMRNKNHIVYAKIASICAECDGGSEMEYYFDDKGNTLAFKESVWMRYTPSCVIGYEGPEDASFMSKYEAYYDANHNVLKESYEINNGEMKADLNCYKKEMLKRKHSGEYKTLLEFLKDKKGVQL